MSRATETAVVLCLSGHDPSGGAGVQADIEAIAALGGHALSVITAHTVQDSRDVRRVQPADAALLREQVEAVLADARVDAVKIGLIGDAAQLPLLRQVLERLGRPVVLDPVLRAGGGSELAAAGFPAALRRELLAHVTILTPNAAEARRLVPEVATLDEAGAALLRSGASHVLITGGDEPGDPVVNHWHAPGRAPRRFAWPRLPGAFHGAGCTLASAIAVRLAQGAAVGAALEDAQAYVHRTLRHARRIGRGRAIPRRGAP